MIWFCSTDGTIRALDAENGELVWMKFQGHQCPVQPVFGADSNGDIKIFSLIGSGGVLGRSEAIPGALLAYGLSENNNSAKIIIEEVPVNVEKEVVRTEEIISPMSYVVLGLSLILIIISGMLFIRSRN